MCRGQGSLLKAALAHSDELNVSYLSNKERNVGGAGRHGNEQSMWFDPLQQAWYGSSCCGSILCSKHGRGAVVGVRLFVASMLHSLCLKPNYSIATSRTGAKGFLFVK